MSILKGLGRMLQHSATNDLKHRLTIKLTKVLTKLDIEYTDQELDTLVNEVLMTIGNWSSDGGQAIKEAFAVAMQDSPKRMRNNRG